MGEALASIIIPVYNQLDYTRLCLSSIRLHTKGPYEIIIIDNCSTDGTGEYLLQQKGNMTIVENHENMGYAKACNQGMRLAKGEFIVLLNNDVVVTPNWLDNLLLCLLQGKKAGMAGPVSNYAFGHQRLGRQFSTMDDIEDFAGKFNRSNPHLWISVQRLAGFCLLLHKDLIESIGYLDEGFAIGGMEDDDYCLRAIKAGYKLYCAKDTFVYHFGSATFRGEGFNIKEIMSANRKRLLKKWPDDLL